MLKKTRGGGGSILGSFSNPPFTPPITFAAINAHGRSSGEPLVNESTSAKNTQIYPIWQFSWTITAVEALPHWPCAIGHAAPAHNSPSVSSNKPRINPRRGVFYLFIFYLSSFDENLQVIKPSARTQENNNNDGGVGGETTTTKKKKHTPSGIN